MTKDTATFLLKGLAFSLAHRPSDVEAVEMAIRSLDAWGDLIEAVQDYASECMTTAYDIDDKESSCWYSGKAAGAEYILKMIEDDVMKDVMHEEVTR